MGLDIYLYKVRKPNIDENASILDTGDFLDKDGQYISLMEMKDYNKLSKVHPIKRNAVKIELVSEAIDVKKFAKSKGIKRINSVKLNEFNKRTKTFEIMINNKVFTEKLKFFKDNDFILKNKKYVYGYVSDEVAYQRGINDLGWEILSQIGNTTTYYKPIIIKRLISLGLLNDEFAKYVDDKDTFFLAWW